MQSWETPTSLNKGQKPILQTDPQRVATAVQLVLAAPSIRRQPHPAANAIVPIHRLRGA